MEPVQSLPTPPHVVTYAGFWKRFFAYIIDKLILSVIACIILIPFIATVGVSAFLHGGDEEPPIEFFVALISTYLPAILLIVVADWLYYALLESKRGATLGKMALGIQVTDMNGNRITFPRATGRHFGKIISALILYVGFMIAGFTQQKQALHDIIAGTLVINK